MIRRRMIHALNSGANVFMEDFEDALSPTWSNLVLGQLVVDGRPAAASLFDFGLAFFHNAHALLERGQGPWF